MVKNIFIVGMEKSGTTALAQWLVDNEYAEYLKVGVKEPNIYYKYDDVFFARESDKPLLDASVSYATTPRAISRLPHHDTKIVICLRNPLLRAWSAYKMYKTFLLRNSASAELCKAFYEGASIKPDIINEFTSYNFYRRLVRNNYPRKSSHVVDGYFDREVENILSGDFLSRIEYESNFFLARSGYPIFSVLVNSFIYRTISSIAEKYQPEDVVIVSLSSLEDQVSRDDFLNRIGCSVKGSPSIGKVFSSDMVTFCEKKPDFSSSRLNFLKMAFEFDMNESLDLVGRKGIFSGFIDMEALKVL